ncbi:hypothetical protein ColLi_12560 [Colletotrichum liriopes]|uniref:Uncharacterized protein n=1 Tax=Colletotrichum liriopes TaxID=708192 RepID=A0AA37GZ63_9PEZI|nr:hypothetical protein ColLi_12560 [Colletotrichum liriopes]
MAERPMSPSNAPRNRAAGAREDPSQDIRQQTASLFLLAARSRFPSPPPCAHESSSHASPILLPPIPPQDLPLSPEVVRPECQRAVERQWQQQREVVVHTEATGTMDLAASHPRPRSWSRAASPAASKTPQLFLQSAPGARF